MGPGGAQSLNQLEITILTLDLSTVHISVTISELHQLDILYCNTIGIVLLTKQFWACT